MLGPQFPQGVGAVEAHRVGLGTRGPGSLDLAEAPGALARQTQAARLLTQFGAYGVFMTPGPIYLKAKAGYAYTDVFVSGRGSSKPSRLLRYSHGSLSVTWRDAKRIYVCGGASVGTALWLAAARDGALSALHFHS